jgi:hypothetical protein
VAPRLFALRTNQFARWTNGSPYHYNDSKELAEKTKDQYEEYWPSPPVHSIYSELHDACAAGVSVELYMPQLKFTLSKP